MKVNNKDCIMRILKAELKSFKNVGYGSIEMPSYLNKSYYDDDAEILGLYGQNGSGKTAVIDAAVFLKCLLCGNSLPDNTADYIMATENSAECSFDFYFESDGERYIVSYSYILEKTKSSDGGETVCVSSENIYYRRIDDGKLLTKKLAVGYDRHSVDEYTVKPKKLMSVLYSADKRNRVELAVQKKLAEKEGRSYLFTAEVGDILAAVLGETDIIVAFIRALKLYARDYLYIIRANIRSGAFLDQRSGKADSRSGGIYDSSAENFGGTRADVSVRSGSSDKNGHITFNLPAPYGAVSIPMNEPAVIPKEMYRYFSRAVEDTDRIMKHIIPGLNFELCEYGPQLTYDGREGMRTEIISVRDGKRIPLKYESDGIKKLFSIFNILITMYKDESVCVIVDEFDSGIYEHLFGELIEILGDYGRGQLIFTSHNLRPLETIDPDMLVFTTTNPQNRYIRLEKSSGIGNLRDVYLRSIDLGGQREEISLPSNSFEINRAFRNAYDRRLDISDSEEV